MTWGQSWGTAWGSSFGDSLGAPGVFDGSGSLEQLAPEVSGAAFCGPKVQVSTGGGGGANFSRSIRGPLDLVADVRRERAMDALGLRLTGTGLVEHPGGDLVGSARNARVALVATSAAVGTGAGESAAGPAEFRDVELEMVALLLAA